MATQTTDTSNIARQSDQGVATFNRPKGQSLIDTLADYSDDFEGYVRSGRGIYDAVTGKEKPPATTPKPPGPAEPKTDYTKYALIGGGILALLLVGGWLLKR